MRIVETCGLRKEFGTLVAVSDVDLSVERGEVLGLIGPNGAGKTTLLRMLLTLLKPTDGTACVMGYDLMEGYLDIRKRIGYLPDFFNLYNDLTLAECLSYFAHAYGVDGGEIGGRVDSSLEYVGLEEKRDEFIRNLSRGMVQRLGVGVLLVRDCDVFLLDEPASGLDPAARIRLREILCRLASEGKTVIISSHILSELSGFCSHVAIMNEGRLVVHGPVDEVERKATGVRRVKVSLTGRAEEAAGVLEQSEKVKVAEVELSKLTIEVDGGDEELAEVNRVMVDAGIGVCGFCEEGTDLENLFMRIQKGQ